ncbi:MAG: HAD family hydrolase [Spirochaetia bacterium]
MNKEYNAYLFDADGTLLDTFEMIYQCFQHTLGKYDGPDVDRKTIESHVGIPLRTQLEHYLGELDDKMAAEIVKTHGDYQYRIYKDYLQPFPDVLSVLSRLKNAGKKLAVVTSRREPSISDYLEHIGALDLFTAIITPDHAERPKPHPAPVLKALSELGVDKGDALFVGDAVYDIQAGNSAGVDTAFVSWSKVDLNGHTPTYRINSFTELLPDSVQVK